MSTPAFERAVIASARSIDVGQLARELLPSLVEEFDASLVGCFVDHADGSLDGHAPPDMPELVSAYSRTHAPVDPLHAAKCSTGDAIVIPTRLVPRKVFHASQAYADVYYPAKIEHLAVLRTRQPGEEEGLGVVIGRSASHGDFSTAHERTLAQLLPVLRATAERLARAETASRRVAALALLVESLEKDGSMLLLDPDGKLVWCSSGAARFDLALCVDALGVSARVMCRKRSATAHLTLESTGMRARASLSLVDGDPRGPLVLVRLRDPGEKDPLARWAKASGLTKGETRILRALCDGGTNVEIGRRLCLSPATVRTHIDHIFRKLDVSSRLQAVLKAQKGTRTAPP